MLAKTRPLCGRVVPERVPRTIFPEEESNIKKPALPSVVAVLTFLPLGVQAQKTDSSLYHDSDVQKSFKKPTSFSGEVGSDGKTLTADRDRRIWKVSNPEILSGIDAYQVRVRAHVDATRGQVHILSIGAVADERAGIELDDAAFRR
jgi:hypothetical protein